MAVNAYTCATRTSSASGTDSCNVCAPVPPGPCVMAGMREARELVAVVHERLVARGQCPTGHCFVRGLEGDDERMLFVQRKGVAAHFQLRANLRAGPRGHRRREAQ